MHRQSAPYPNFSESTFRGKSCNACRRRKLKCDGTRPYCSQCSKSKIEDDCEYEDGTHKSHTRLLLEQISRLESRIQELECQPRQKIPLVCEQSKSSANVSRNGCLKSTMELTTMTNVLPLPWSSSNQPSTLVIQEEMSREPQLSRDTIQQLIEAVTPHRFQLGLRMSQANFYRISKCREVDSEDPFLNAICLWGSRFSNMPAHRALEPQLLNKCIHSITGSLGGPLPIAPVRASCLLSLYFLVTGRLLEGRYHACAAVSLALKHRLHQLGGFSSPVPCQSVAAAGALDFCASARDSLHASDPTDWYDGVQTFWQVFYLDCCWSVAIGLPHALCERDEPQARIDTPWPHDNGELSAAIGVHSSVDTLRALLDPKYVDVMPTKASFSVRAAAFLERSSWIATRYSPDVHNAGWWEEYTVIDDAMHRLLLYMPTSADVASSFDTDPENALEYTTAITLLSTAIVHLRFPIGMAGLQFCQECLHSIARIVELIKIIDDKWFAYLDPIFGMCWLSAMGVLLRHRTKISVVLQPDLDAMADAIAQVRIIVDAMTKLARIFPVAALQAMKAEEAFTVHY